MISKIRRQTLRNVLEKKTWRPTITHPLIRNVSTVNLIGIFLFFVIFHLIATIVKVDGKSIAGKLRFYKASCAKHGQVLPEGMEDRV